MNLRNFAKKNVYECALVIAWSSGFIGAKLAAETESVFLVLFWRFAIVAIVLAPFVVVSIRSKPSWRTFFTQCILGSLAMFCYLAFGVKSIELGVSAGTASLISALQPLMTAALAGPVLGEMVSPRKWFGLVLGLGGVLIAVGGAWDSAPMVAYGLSFIATIGLVAATLIAKALNPSISIFSALGIQSGISALLMMPLAVQEVSLVPELNLDFVFAVLWFVIFSTIGAYGLYWKCLQYSSATRISSLIYLTPPVTIIWGWAMFGEEISASILIALPLCLCGVVIANYKTSEIKHVDRK
jgi:drug/metabolite transporter (DMT)-like permease